MGLAPREFGLITFDSTHNAIMSEKILLKAQLDINVIPVPSEISAGCGLSLKTELQAMSVAASILEQNSIPVSGFYSVRLNGLKKEINPFPYDNIKT